MNGRSSSASSASVGECCSSSAGRHGSYPGSASKQSDRTVTFNYWVMTSLPATMPRRVAFFRMSNGSVIALLRVQRPFHLIPGARNPSCKFVVTACTA